MPSRDREVSMATAPIVDGSNDGLSRKLREVKTELRRRRYLCGGRPVRAVANAINSANPNRPAGPGRTILTIRPNLADRLGANEMTDFYESLAHEQIEFIEPRQPFFDASAQDSRRANLSPKGLDAFRVFDLTRILSRQDRIRARDLCTDREWQTPGADGGRAREARRGPHRPAPVRQRRLAWIGWSRPQIPERRGGGPP